MKELFRHSKLRKGSRIYLFGIVLAIGFSLGCTRSVSSAAQATYLDVFSDFVFVGSGPCDPKSIRVPAHEMKQLQLPHELNAGYQYIFHRPANINSDFKTLIARLEKREIKIVSSSADTDRSVGGPGFRIVFQGNEFNGFIFNVLDGQVLNNEALVNEWGIDDYVLWFSPNRDPDTPPISQPEDESVGELVL